LNFLPESFSRENDYGSFSYDSRSKGRKIFIKVSYIRASSRIPVEGYQEWKTFAAEIKKKTGETIVFKKD